MDRILFRKGRNWRLWTGIILIFAILIGILIFRGNAPESGLSSPETLLLQTGEELGFDGRFGGQPPSARGINEVILPHVRSVKCRSVVQTLNIPVPDAESLRIEVKVFYDGENVVRIQSLPKPGWRHPRTLKEVEEILQWNGEQIYGFGKPPQPRKWHELFTGLAKFVDLRKAKYFEATYVEQAKSSWRGSVYIFNIYGARGFDGVSQDPRENNLRVVYDPGQQGFVLDEAL